MDISSVLSIAQVGISIVSTILTAVVFMVIKFNDLKHLDDKVEKMSASVQAGFDNLEKRMNNYAERISTVEGYLTCKLARKRKAKTDISQG